MTDFQKTFQKLFPSAEPASRKWMCLDHRTVSWL